MDTGGRGGEGMAYEGVVGVEVGWEDGLGGVEGVAGRWEDSQRWYKL